MIDKKQCKTCKYRALIANGTLLICQYILVEHEMRKCNADKCDKYEKGKPYEEHNF